MSTSPAIENVLAHLRGDDDPRRCPGWETPQEALQGAEMLEWMREHRELLEPLRVFHAATPTLKPTPNTPTTPSKTKTEPGRSRSREEWEGLARLYAWICAEEGAACLEAGEMAKRFAAGEDREARYRAAEVYADALLRLDRALGNDAGIFFGLKEELSRVERRYRERAAAIWAPESWEALSQSRQEKALEAEE